MAKSDNLNKGRKIATRNKVIVGAVIATIIIAIVGYFIYILGLVPKYATAVRIEGTVATDSGDIKINKKISVLEANYHFMEVYNQQAYYLMYVYGVTDFDAVADQTTGKTYREMLYDQAADELLNIVVYNELADRYPDFHSAADRYTSLAVNHIREQAESQSNSMTADRYLQSSYGTGMTVNQFRKIVQREIRGIEFENYMKQFILVNTEADIREDYNDDPSLYQTVNYNAYFFAYEVDENGEVTDREAATAQAEEVAAAVEAGSDLRSAVIASIGEDAENATVLERFGYTLNEDNELVVPDEDEILDPTSYKNKTKTDVENYHFDEFIYAADRAEGDVTTVPADNGIYVVRFDSFTLDETTTVVYRTLTLKTNVTYLGSSETECSSAIAAAQERANNLRNSAATALDFSNLVKDNTDNTDEILNGGYHDGVTAEDETIAADEALSTWMFDGARRVGDTIVITSEDGSAVTVYYIESIVPAWVYTGQVAAGTALSNSWANGFRSNVTASISYDMIKNYIY